MSRSRFAPFLTSMLPALPGFACKGRLLFVAPLGEVLQGISFEPSAFDRVTFMMETFVMPMCVPTDHIYFSFGENLRHPERGYGWSSEIPDVTAEVIDTLRRDALPFLERRNSLEAFIDATPQRPDLYTPQALGFSLARIGRVEEAITMLDQMFTLALTRQWEFDLVARAHAFKTQLIDDPATAQRQLIAWETETIDNLGLTKFRRQ